ncbi:MAG: ATP-dependent Clp protease ATP-binding subunit [Candidatus Levybacteria bacterium]|nr:ATP-dependent Clp protease ATP-binding subunit [Candidatus Levybacteria bacterium]
MNNYPQFVLFYHWVSLLPVRLIRVLVFLSLFSVTLISMFNGSYHAFAWRALIFLLTADVLFELFFFFKITKLAPPVPVSQNNENNLYFSCSLSALEALLVGNSYQKLLFLLLKRKSVQFFLKKANIEQKDIQAIPIGKEDIIKNAFQLAKEGRMEQVTAVDIFVSYLLLSEPKTKLLFNNEIKTEEALHILFWAKVDFEFQKKQSIWQVGRGFADPWVSGWTLELAKYGYSFTDKVFQSVSQQSQFVGRDDIVEKLIAALSKSNRQNAVLIGNPGVGKTTVVAAFAIKSYSGALTPSLNRKEIFGLSVSALLAGAENQGVFEERIKNLILELEHVGNIILYVPQIENLVGGGGFGLDATGVLLPLLMGDKIQVIGTTTPQAYKAYIEKKSEFASLLTSVVIEEPSFDEAIRMLEEASLPIEQKHKVNITYHAIIASVSLSQKYLPDRFLPGKAIDLLDEVAPRVKLEKKRDVTKEDIIMMVEAKTHVPIGAPKKEEQEKLLQMEEILHKRVINQEEAVRAVSQALRRLRAGIAFENRPIGTFLFLGPTGVGKTEVAKALAQMYFGSQDYMIRLDMGTYKDNSSINRLIGSAPGMGEERGELSEKVSAQPFSLVLLDEFEKAHSGIADAFLSIFDDGVLTDAKGRKISFVNTIIIATSNAGAEMIRQNIKAGQRLQEIKEKLLDELQKKGTFKPELLNRFDAIVLFEPLKKEHIEAVTAQLLQKITAKLAQQDITLAFDAKAIKKIATESYDQEYGARPIKRFIQDNIEDILSQKMLRQEITRGSNVLVATDAANAITVSVA